MKAGKLKRAAAAAAMAGMACLIAGSMPYGHENALESVPLACKTAAARSPQFRVIILNPRSGAGTAAGGAPQSSESTGPSGPAALPNYKGETLTLALIAAGGRPPQ